jgi:hypothetical protein
MLCYALFSGREISLDISDLEEIASQLDSHYKPITFQDSGMGVAGPWHV